MPDIYIRGSEATHEQIRLIAFRERKSKAQVARELIEEALDYRVRLAEAEEVR
jgi:hypothetical protein